MPILQTSEQPLIGNFLYLASGDTIKNYKSLIFIKYFYY